MLDIECLEFRARSGKPVDVRCLDLRAMEPDVRPAEIIGEDVDDVRTGWGAFRGDANHGAEQEQHEHGE